MSLLDDVSLMITPNGVAEDVLFGVLPTPIIGTEEITNGDFANGSTDWDLYQTGSSTVTFPDVASINIDGSISNVGLYQQNVFTIGKQYKIVLNMKASATFLAEILESQGAAIETTIGNVSLTTSYQDFIFYFP